MTKSKQTNNAAPAGIPVADLVVGRVYVDRLSFLRVMVLEHAHTGPDPHDVRKQVRKLDRYGWYYSAVWGKHMRMELHDGQLMETAQ
jgi:hypothetical protein